MIGKIQVRKSQDGMAGILGTCGSEYDKLDGMLGIRVQVEGRIGWKLESNMGEQWGRVLAVEVVNL